jgi:uncharacterized protein (DUF2252 family)
MSTTIARLRPRDREPILAQRRTVKMAKSAHAYVRGSTAQFYEWLGTKQGQSVPHGPAIWICGDCHLGNLGPVASAKGSVEIEIRDLDQTVIGNPAHDLIRLSLSLATAVRGSDLPGITTALALEHMIAGYEEALEGQSRRSSMARPIRKILEKALKRRWKHLAEERIEDVRPEIPRSRRFWALSKQEDREIEAAFSDKRVTGLLTSLRQRDAQDAVSVVDAAYWIKGCSSLGRLRYAVLVGIGKPKHYAKGGLCLVDIKEAVAAAAPSYPRAAMPKDHGQRVVEGARCLSPYLGQRMLATKFLGRPVVLRELLPQDLKLEMDQLTREDVIMSARYLAGVVGRAHARQLGAGERNEWRRALRRNRPKSLDAPSWLWRSVVDLLAIHETAYLEHCRLYASSGLERRC